MRFSFAIPFRGELNGSSDLTIRQNLFLMLHKFQIIRQAMPEYAAPVTSGHLMRQSVRTVHSPFDQKYNAIAVPKGCLNAISGFANEIGNVDDGQRIGALDFQPIARFERAKRLAGLQSRQRTFESGKVEFGRRHR
jgi:hypothetical protein